MKRLGLLILGMLAGPAAAAPPADPGRLFYTPAQRHQLEQTRTHGAGRAAPRSGEAAAAPLRYDGIVIRSDGQSTRWVDGRPQAGHAGTGGLKPGQIRAGSRIYEPYQVLTPVAPPAESTP